VQGWERLNNFIHRELPRGLLVLSMGRAPSTPPIWRLRPLVVIYDMAIHASDSSA